MVCAQGDPVMVRAAAARLQDQAETLDCAAGCLVAPLEMADNISDFADRSRAAVLSVREQSSALAERLRQCAAQILRAADALEAEIARGEGSW